MTASSASARIAGIGPSPGTARASLLNIVGDLGDPGGHAIPTSAFIEVMGEIGHSEHAVRQAISRCSTAGWIVGERHGRTTRWALTTTGSAVVRDGIWGVEHLADPIADWDGQWLTLVITIPVDQRAIRDSVYRALRWDGFGNPAPSVWVTPHPQRRRRTDAALKAAGLTPHTTAFRGVPDDMGMTTPTIVERGWNLADLTGLYADLIARFSSMGPISDRDYLNALLALDQELQHLLVTDPRLPAMLTPGWSGRDDAAQLLELRRAWHPGADAYWTQVLARHT